METINSIALGTHIVTGFIALVAGMIVIVKRKGGTTHKGLGQLFFWMMVLVGFSAIELSIVHPNAFLFHLGVFTLFMNYCGCRSIRNKSLRPNILGWMVWAMALVNGIFMLGSNHTLTFIFGIISILLLAQDLYLGISALLGKTLKKKAWLIRHITMMLATYIATFTAFLVTNINLPNYGLFIWLGPTVVFSPMIYYWIRKVRIYKSLFASTKSIAIVFCLIISGTLSAQLYTETQTRHRFAQMTVGADFQSSLGGYSYFSNEGNIERLDIDPFSIGRVTIGGTHFWGHADFYITIPVLSLKQTQSQQELTFTSGVETVFKYYPWVIQHNKIRPFVGVAITQYEFEHDNNLLENGDGPDVMSTRLPFLAGLTFNSKGHIFEATLTYNYKNKLDYYISTTESKDIGLPPFFLGVGYKYMFDTTISAEKNWENGKIQAHTATLTEQSKLDGFFIGAGMSSAWFIGNSSFNKNEHPYIRDHRISVMPDLALGYYWAKKEINATMSYRGYASTIDAYGLVQTARRKSLAFEVTKNMGDYHGFVPFIGPAISLERLSVAEAIDGEVTYSERDDKLSYGVTFGWDIRPTALNNWYLRTNLRYFPSLSLDVKGNQKIDFKNIEFNFIQLIIYPGAKKKRRS